ncbi:glycosyltransferase family 4 protein [Candidatus Peregrinibacteria bacterium]|nr:glycosyltransferase family 4 protein [Candidatus Parcubacteria bacterium]NCS68067.1 glycosyltransferase family 4 protein [Candidatus Peregrinibacteria bacterium]PIX85808.1 MAG: hypothetical protein COZ32_06575 [Nitrospirae bacterium CG_4_10_14_3_um_filter_53_41]
MKPKVMIITSVHRWDDTRIFHRQASSLAKYYDVELHAPADFDSKELNGVRIVGLPKWKKKRDRAKLWWILFKRVFKSKAGIVHFHDPELIPLGIVIKFFSKRKVIYDVHEHVISDIEGKNWIPGYLRLFIIKVFIFLERICVPKFDAVIYTTPTVGERYLKLSKRAISIENYAKIDTFLRTRLNKNKSFPKTAIFLGRVLDFRGVDRVIKAFQVIVKRIPDARFMIVGDIVPENYEIELRSLRKELELEEHVEFTGFVPHLETVRYLEQADCGVVTFLPTEVNKACLPNKLFEYMASALPVIASDFPLYKEVVESSQCGLCIDPNNIDAIADAIIRIFKNHDIGLEMGLRGREAFMKKYNWEKEEKKLLALYGELCP